MPTSIPEIPLVKRTDQMGVAKLAVFAYHRDSGLPVWQSGLASETSEAKDIWVLGAGPFQKGTIYEGFVFAGQKLELSNPLVRRTPAVDEEEEAVSLTQERTFEDPSTAIALRPLPNAPTTTTKPSAESAASGANRPAAPKIAAPAPPASTVGAAAPSRPGPPAPAAGTTPQRSPPRVSAVPLRPLMRPLPAQ
jgi:hypothetical protein